MPLNDRNQNTLVDLAIKVGLGGAGLFALNWAYKKYLAKSQGAQAGTSLATQQAMLLYAAMYQSGVSILSWADGTDEKSLYATAAQITNFAEVSKAYSNLYTGKILADDLTNELGTDELRAFYLALKKPANTEASLQSFAQKNGFLYRIGQTLKSSPPTGMAKVGYYSVIKTATSVTLKNQRWNQLAGSQIGVIKGYRLQRIKDVDGTLKTVRLYLVDNIPNMSADIKYYVFERETKKV